MNKRVFANVLVLGAFVALAFGPWRKLFGERIDLLHALADPSLAHPFGTDSMGRDLLVRLSSAVVDAVLPLWLAVLAATVFGITLGVWACVVRAQSALSFLVLGMDWCAAAIASVPLFLLVFAWSVVTERAGLMPVLAALSAVLVMRSYLEVRDLERRDQNLGYWQAHAAMGGSRWERIWCYGVRSAWGEQLGAMVSFHGRIAVAIEASLSYLGFGIQEPAASFGNLLAAHFELYLKGHGQTLMFILAALTLTMLVPAALTGWNSKSSGAVI